MKRRLDSTEADVTLKVADKTFACCRKVLAECSPYFDAMFNSDFLEKDKNVIEIKGVDTDAMGILLHSTEANEVDVLKSANVLSVLQAACMLQFEAVKRSCIDLIMSKWLAVDSCLQIVHTALQLDLCELHSKALALALWEFSQVKRTTSFIQLSIADLEVYLQADGLNVRHGEFEVFDAGISWVEEAVEERAQFLMHVIQCVRFVEVLGDDVQTMLLYPLVTEDAEVVQLLECICNMKSISRNECQHSVREDVESESNSLLEGSKYLAPVLSADNAPGCYERLCQCAYFSGGSFKVSSNFLQNGLRPSSVGADCSHPERDPSCSSLVELPEQCWGATVIDVAGRLLRQSPRWWPVLPCIVGHTVEETRGASLPAGKPFVFCYDEEKGDVVPVVQLAKISDGPVELSGYKIASRGPSIFITGGEFLLGHGSWNRTVWRYSLLSESWGYETSIPSVRRHHSVCFMDDDLYLIGGFGKHRVIMSSVEKYNVTSRKWTRCTPLPQPLYNAACVAHKGRILVFSQQMFVYSPDCDMWTSLNLHTSSTCLGFNSAMSHGDVVFLTGMYSTLLARYSPDPGTMEGEQLVDSVGTFKGNAAYTCVVGDLIYNFTSDDEDETLFLEVFSVKEGEFRVVWRSSDCPVEFSGSKKWSSCFPLVKY
ncbi:kelch-like protein 40 [Bacillus rossius redtenbacheri]|uniref:kelch-like protein 40 n=1 Tax=Bacillus rossius redtenbacheri TaxID=93214 RepID=UPI002FDE69EE